MLLVKPLLLLLPRLYLVVEVAVQAQDVGVAQV